MPIAIWLASMFSILFTSGLQARKRNSMSDVNPSNSIGDFLQKKHIEMATRTAALLTIENDINDGMGTYIRL